MSSAGPRLLVVEDEDATRRSLVTYLTRRDYRVLEAASAADALRCWDANRPDLILLDLNLPRKNGREVLAEIKADDNLKRIPVVVMTSSSAEEDIVKSYELHANGYITKPINFSEFEKVMHSLDDFWFKIVKLPPK